MMSLIEKANSFLRDVGFPYSISEKHLINKFVRFGESDEYWLIGSIDNWKNTPQITLTCGNWKNAEQKHYFNSLEKESKSWTDEEKKAFHEDQKKKMRAAEMASHELNQCAIKNALHIWENSEAFHAGKDNGYISSKGLINYEHATLKVHQGEILIAMHRAKDGFSGFQRIYKDKDGFQKRFFKDTNAKGAYSVIPGSAGSKSHAFGICEGYATGKTIQEATGLTVYVAFMASNLLAIAKHVRESHPDAKIFVFADNDYESAKKTGKNTGLVAGKEAAHDVAGYCIYPSDDGGSGLESVGSDFNDFFIYKGMEETKKELERQMSGGVGVSIDNKPQDEKTDFPNEKTKENSSTAPLLQGSADGVSSEIQNNDNSPPQETETHDDPIFPVDALGPLMANATKVIAETVSAPIEMVCSSMLAAAAVCVQPFFNIKAFGGIRPISLFFITIAESGERKSTVDKLVLSEHYKWRKEKDEIYTKEKAKYQAEMEEWKNSSHNNSLAKTPRPKAPRAPLLFVSEPTVEGLFFCLKYHRDSIGLFSDEGGSFLGGYSMKQENSKATLAKLNKLWDGDPIDKVRKGKDEGEIDILYNKRISLHLMMQTKLAHELFSNEYAKSQGFLARCLTCEPKSKIGNRKFMYEIAIPKEMEEFNKQVRYFLDKNMTEPQILTPSDGALEIIEAFYYEIEPLQKAGEKLDNIKDFASKVIEHCIRIAAVIECFNNEEATEIGAKTMYDAICIGKYYLQTQSKTTSHSSIYPSKEAEVLHGIIGKKPEWKTRELLMIAPKKLRKKDRLYPVLEQLEKAGYCSFDKEKHTVKL